MTPVSPPQTHLQGQGQICLSPSPAPFSLFLMPIRGLVSFKRCRVTEDEKLAHAVESQFHVNM